MGTADTAGGVNAMILKSYLDEIGRLSGNPIDIEVRSDLATNASAFDIREDMSDTLIIAISQSGSTADTNTYLSMATLERAAGKGALLLGIINKRDSDGDKMIRQAGGGVIYTGTGRDVEIAVASTKAFYAQIAAGTILSMKIAEALAEKINDSKVTSKFNHTLLGDIEQFVGEAPTRGEEPYNIPDKLRTFLGALGKDAEGNEKPHVLKDVAAYWALQRTEWKIVGGGQSFYAAKEGRIKLGELDYRSFPFDNLRGYESPDTLKKSWVICNLADMQGEGRKFYEKGPERVMDMLKAGAAVTVVAHEGDDRFLAKEGKGRFDEWLTPVQGEMLPRLTVIYVPKTTEKFAAIVNTAADHALGYFVARAMNDRADRCKEAKAQLERQGVYTALAGRLKDIVRDINEGMYNTGFPPEMAMTFIERFMRLSKEPDNPHFLKSMEEILDIMIAVNTHPIDAVLHQAKFVTVGATRKSFDLRIGRRIQEVFEDSAFPLLEGDHRIAERLYKDYCQNMKTQVHLEELPSGGTRIMVVAEKDAADENGAAKSAEIRGILKGSGLVITGEDQLVIDDIPSSNTIIKVFDVSASAKKLAGSKTGSAIVKGLIDGRKRKFDEASQALKGQSKMYPDPAHDVPEYMEGMLSEKLGLSDDMEPNIRLDRPEFPMGLRKRIRKGEIKRIIIAGEDISNAAGDAIRGVIEGYVRDVKNLLAKEAAERGIDLSGYDFNVDVKSVTALDALSFEVADKMSDTLVIGIPTPGRNAELNDFMEKAGERGAGLLGIVGDAAQDIVHTVVDDFNGGIFTIDDERGWPYQNRIAAGSIYAMSIAQALAESVYNRVKEGQKTGPEDAQVPLELDIYERMNEILADDIVELRYGIPNHMRVFINGVARAKKENLDHPLLKAVKYWFHKKTEWKVMGGGPGHDVTSYSIKRVSRICGKFVPSEYEENYKHVDTSTQSLVVLNLANNRGLGNTFNLDT
ncbi:MAG: hypothetical protein ABH825_01195, partial [Candidatus Omnitrophota bacterium]